MKSFVALLALVAVAAADVAHLRTAEDAAEIVSQIVNVEPDNYQSAFQTSNGISGNEAGQLKNAGRDDEAFEVQGEHSYTNPEGQVVRLAYTADALGFHPVGDHLPTAPPPQPIPDYIIKSLAYIAAHPPKPESKF